MKEGRKANKKTFETIKIEVLKENHKNCWTYE